MGTLETLISFSPWIKDKNWEVKDKHLVNLKKSGIHFRHLTKEMDFEKGAINILRGPRQIGKTTELKLMIRDLLLKDINPNAIFYLPCDNVLNRKDLYEHMAVIIEHFQEQNIRKGYVFIDEITSIKDWQKTIKGLSDSGQLINLSILITGSSAIEIKRGYERMPGRRGAGKDMVLLPMRFHDFCKCFGLKQEVEFNLYQIVKDKNAFDKFKHAVLRQEKQFIKMLGLYFQYGGFPFVVAEIVKNKELRTEAEDIISSVMVSEIEKEKLNISVLKSILLKIAGSLTGTLSYNSIAKDSDIYSAEGAQKYLNILAASFIGFPVKCLDLNKKKAFPKKNIKVYLTDPMFINVIIKQYRGMPVDEAKLAEMLVAIHLVRTFSEQWAKYAGVDSLYYWQSKNNKEIDFVLYKDNKPFGFEVKYQNNVSGWDEMSIKKGLGHGVLITRNCFEYGTVSKLPLWAFLLTGI